MAVDGNATLSTGAGLNDLTINFFDDRSVADLRLGTFLATGTFVLAVPEPSSATLMVLSALSLGIIRRRSRP